MSNEIAASVAVNDPRVPPLVEFIEQADLDLTCFHMSPDKDDVQTIARTVVAYLDREAERESEANSGVRTWHLAAGQYADVEVVGVVTATYEDAVLVANRLSAENARRGRAHDMIEVRVKPIVVFAADGSIEQEWKEIT